MQEHLGDRAGAAGSRARRLVWALPVAALLLAIGRANVPAGNGLDARYYASATPQGAPVHSGLDRVPSTRTIRERWPRARPERFSVTWSGYLTVTTRGTYEFATTSDDGSQLFIDDILVVDNSGMHSVRTMTGTLRLTSGPHRLRLIFVNEAGDFSFDWSWGTQGGRRSAIGAWQLATSPVRPAQAYLGRFLDIAFDVIVVPAFFVLSWKAWVFARGLPPIAVNRIRRAVAVVAALLPIFLAAHAFAFWGRGVIDEEATTFVINYLADRPFWQAILDPQLNDWGSFQARELAYVFDRLDARLFARLLVDHHRLLFVPLSSMLCLPAICVVFLIGARRVLRLDRTTALLLLSLFLSCIVTQASTPILYRSSKMLLSVAVLAFLFVMTALLRPERRRVGLGPASCLFASGVLMTLCDRQGWAYLLSATTVVAVLWMRQRWLTTGAGAVPHRQYGPVVVASGAATIAAVLYNNVIAPQAILRANGYWPDMSYEDIPFERFNAGVVSNTLQMFGDQVGFLFGNLPFIAFCALALGIWMVAWVGRDSTERTGLWRFVTSTGVIVSGAFVAVPLVLIAVMGMRHPPVFTIVDHEYWYYTLSLQALLLFGAALAMAQLPPTSSRSLPVQLILILLVAGNVLHYRGQRELLAASGDWFGKQLAFAQLYAQSFDARARSDAAADPLPSWMGVRENGIVIHLPLRAYGLLDAIRAGYLTLQRRHPFADASGPYWRELRNFLDGSGSPLIEPEHLPEAIEALRGVGVRQIVVHRRDYEQAADPDAVIAAARLLHGIVQRVVEGDQVATIELSDAPSSGVSQNGWRQVPSSAAQLTLSEHAEMAPLLVDRQNDTGWTTTAAQNGQEWIRVALDRPRRVKAIELLVTDQALERYPRALAVESTGSSGTRTLFSGSSLPALFRGLLARPVDAPILIALPPNESAVIVIRQTGRSPSWSWSVRELRLFE